MNKLLYTILIVLSFYSISTSQNIVGSYSLKMAPSSLNVEYGELDEGRMVSLIDCHSTDYSKRPVGFYIKEADHAKFEDAIEKCIQKYEEWKKVAVEESIDQFSKKVNTVDVPVTPYFQESGRLYLCEPSILSFHFTVMTFRGEKMYLLAMKTGSIYSILEDDKNHPGARNSFSNKKELEDFLKAVRLDNIKKEYAKFQKFKD